MLGTSLMLGLIGVFCILDSRLLGRLNFERPLIVSTLVGLVLGDLTQGLMIGASLELMALGLVNIGAAAPPDMNMAAIIATAFSILSKANAETALEFRYSPKKYAWYKAPKDYKNILRLVVKKSPTGESTHYFFHSQDDKVEVSC